MDTNFNKNTAAQTNNGYVLKGEGLTKDFVNGKVETNVLKGIDITVEQGEFVAIVGESGSGKSTLLHLLLGFEKPTSGTVTISGKDIFNLNEKDLAKLRREEFAFVAQFDNLVENLTVYENIALPLMLGGKFDTEKQKEIDKLLDYLQISHTKKQFPNQLSGGEQQRTAIARALIINPKIIFLDEPTGSLDSKMGTQVMELLKEINAKRAVAIIMVTHSQYDAKYATRTITIADGKIINN